MIRIETIARLMPWDETIETKRPIVEDESKIGAVRLKEQPSPSMLNYLLVHRCVNEPGWQITRVGQDGEPWGHTVEPTLQAALDSAAGVPMAISGATYVPYGHGEIIEITTIGG